MRPGPVEEMLRLVRAVVLIAILPAGASPDASGHSELSPRELQGEHENMLFPVDDPWDNLTSDSNTSENSDSFNESEEDWETNVSSNSSNASQEDLELNVGSDGEVDADPLAGLVTGIEDLGIPMEWLEKFYDVIAFGSYYLAVFSLACGLVQVPLAYFMKEGCHFVPKLVYYAFATFFGYLYLGYLITCPAYGIPDWFSDFLFPFPPHLGPPELRDDRMTRFRKTALNTIVMVFLPYLLICLSLLLLGLLVVMISISILFSLLLSLSIFSAVLLDCVQTRLDDTMWIAARAAKAACDNQLDFSDLASDLVNQMKTDEFLDSVHVTSSNVPNWSEGVVNFYAELPTCPCWCHFKGKCFLGCLSFVCFDLPYLVLVELPLWFLTICFAIICEVLLGHFLCAHYLQKP